MQGIPGIAGRLASRCQRFYCRARVSAVSTLVLAGLCVGVTAGCGASSSAATKGNVTIVGSDWIGNAPAWVGIDTGIFKRAGFNVSYKSITASSDRLTAIASGDVQLASVGQQAMLSAMQQGDQTFRWVGNQDVAFGIEGIVARDSISSLAGLKGKRLGVPVGSGSYVTADLLLQQAGLALNKDVQLVNISLEDTVSALANHNVDAVATYDPYFTQARALPGVHVLGTDENSPLYRNYHQMSGPDCLVISSQMVKSAPSRAKRLVQAYFDAVAYIERHPRQAAAIIAKNTHQPLNTVTETMPRFEWHGLAAQPAAMQQIYKQSNVVIPLLKKAGVLQGAPDYRKWVWLDYGTGKAA